MSFLGGFLTPPPATKQPRKEDTASSSSAAEGAEKPTTSIYNAFSGVKSIVSSYSTSKGAATTSASSASLTTSSIGQSSQVKSQHEKELESAMHRFRLQSPENHLGMVMAFSDKSLSPFLSEAFCFTWHRVRTTIGEEEEMQQQGYLDLEDLDIYNTLSQNGHSWYPPTADDLGRVVILHCEDTLGYGLSRQLKSKPLRPDEAFKQRVERAIELNKVLERVVISSCNHHHHIQRSHHQHHRDSRREEGENNSDSDSEGSSVNINVILPEFEVGGSIAVNSEGILLREKGHDDCGLHIDSTNFLTLTCVHPASFIIEIPLYHASSSINHTGHTNMHRQTDDGDMHDDTSDHLAPLSSIRDLSNISTLQPSVEWLGDPEGEMYNSLESVVNPPPEENPLERTLSSLGRGGSEEEGGGDLLFSSLCLQVACRDRATRDVLVLAMRSLAGHVPSSCRPHNSSSSDSSVRGGESDQGMSEDQNEKEDEGGMTDHQRGLPQRLALLPWVSSDEGTQAPAAPSNTPLTLPFDSNTDTEIDTETAITKDLRSEVHRQQERIQDLETLVDQLRTEANEREMEALRLKQQQGRQEEEQEVERAASSGNDSEKHLVRSLQAQLAEEMAARAVLESSCEALTSDLYVSTSQVEALQQELKSLTEAHSAALAANTSSNSAQAEQIEELAELVTELQGGREKAMKALERMQEDNSTLRAQLELQESEGDADTQKQEQDQVETKLEAELQAMREQCATHLASLQASETVVEQLRHQLSLSFDDNTSDVSTGRSSGSSSGSGKQHNTSSDDTEADDDSDSDRGVGSSTTTTCSVLTVYPTSELKTLIDQFNIACHGDDHEGRGESLDDYTNLLSILRGHLSSVASELSDKNKAIEMSDAAALEAQSQHQRFLKTLQDQMQQISEEMTEKAELHRQQSVSSLATIDGLNETINVLQLKLSKVEESKRAMEGKSVGLQKELETLQTLCATLQKEAQIAQQEVDKKESEEQRVLQKELDKLTDECSKWHDECLRLKEMMMSMQKVIKQKDELVIQKKNDFDTLSVRLQEVKQQNDLLTEKSAKETRSFKEQADKFSYEQSQAANAVKVLEARILGLQSETLTLSDERQVLKRQKSAFDSSRNQIAQLRSQLMESDQTAQASRALLEETTALYDRLKKEHTDLTIELANVNTLLEQKTARIEDLKDRLQVMDNEITSSDKVKSSFRKENARLKEANKKLMEDSNTVKKLKPLYNQQLSKIADGQSRIVDLESALSDITIVRNQYALTASALEMRTGVLEKALRRREIHSEREGMAGEDHLAISTMLLEKTSINQANISRLESELSEAKMAEPFELKKLNFMVAKLGGEKNHYENKAKSLSKDLQRKLLAGTPLQRELGKMTARLEEVENERNAYRDAMVLACETYSTKDVSSWFG